MINIDDFSGVYTTVIDSQQHKVTVTGNVDSETLLKKLLRSGKHAELWPAEKKTSGKSKNGQKQKADGDKDVVDQDGAAHEGEKAENAAENDGGKDADGGEEGGDDTDDKEDGENDDAGGENGGGGGSTGGKKKKKKKKKKGGQNGNSPNAGGGGGENPGDAPATGAASALQAGVPALGPTMNIGPPIQHIYPYHPPPTYYQPAPVYGLSYNTTYPSPSASYFAPTMHGNMYSYPEMYPPSGHVHRIHSYSYEDDDGQGGCSIM